jgi:hypothetical protein
MPSVESALPLSGSSPRFAGEFAFFLKIYRLHLQTNNSHLAENQ